MKVLWGARTNFSLGESILTTRRLCERAKELGYTHVAIADTMSVTGLIDAALEAKKAEVELLSGCTLRVQHWDKPGVVFQPKVYCETLESFRELLKTLSSAEQINRQSALTWDTFVALLSAASFIITTGDAMSVFSSAFPASDVDELVKRIEDACSAAQSESQLVAETVGIKSPYFDRLNGEAQAFVARTGLPLIISGMPLYATLGEAEARDVMHAITRNMRLTSTARQILEGTDHSMKSWDDTHALVSVPSDNVLEERLVGALAWRWSKRPVSLPKMADDEYRALLDLCKASWKDRLGHEIMGYKPDAAVMPEYVARLKMELGVLKKLGFCGYFLLVVDLVRWAKSQGIVVGPGRGSVGGSLVAFLIGITEVDPIRFGLLFERFINPERLDLPDADLDFMSARRHEVVGYLSGKYGAECVANISNYNTLGPASAIGEVGKAFDVPAHDLGFKSYLPKEHGQAVPLETCEEIVPELQTYMTKYPHEYQISKQLEGQVRSMGMHAAGVIVAAVPIAERAAVEDRGGVKTVCWDKRVVEDQGLVKMDILGLTNLDVIARALEKIKRDEGLEVNMLDVPLDDPEVLDAFGRADTVGVFQFEGGGMRKLLKDLREGGELTFGDLSAATALFRPGPIDAGLMADYVSVRQGAAMENYEHPNMEAALKSTFGVIVYQEQVMRLARDLAGFSFAGADKLRKAMSKKDHEKMAAERGKWIAGCKEHSGIDEAWSSALFDKIEKFAGYAFNMSHSVEYSIISVWTMWLKIHHPYAFYAASLEVLREDKLSSLVRDAAKRGIEVLPPDINESTSEFRRVGNDLIAPLTRIKGIGEPTEQAILAARAACGGKFASVDELIDKVERRRCNTRHRAILDEVGAFANITPGALPARHPDRVKTQKGLLPGLVIEAVRADRYIVIDDYIKQELTKLYLDLRKENAIVLPRFGKKPKMALVLESPTFQDEKAGKLMETDSAQCIREALRSAGLSLSDVYVTTLLKRPKVDKQASAEEIRFAKPFFEREMELLKPAVIVALGSFVARELCPDEKGGIMELNGKVIFDKARDASVVLTISPGQIWHDPDKQSMMNEAVSRAATLFD